MWSSPRFGSILRERKQILYPLYVFYFGECYNSILFKQPELPAKLRCTVDKKNGMREFENQQLASKHR